MSLEILTHCAKQNNISWSTRKHHSQGLSAFRPDDLDVYMSQFPLQGGAWHHRWMLKATLCGRKCPANKPEPGSAHGRQNILTSQRYTGTCKRVLPDSRTPQTVMLGGISPNIHCGGPRKVASHRMPASSPRLVSVVLTSFKDQHCDFTTIGKI